jgi:hypothetical protein
MFDNEAKDLNFNFKYFIESKEHHDSDDIQRNNKNNIQRTHVFSSNKKSGNRCIYHLNM